MLAKALEITADITLICKRLDSEEAPTGAEVQKIPWTGKLATVEAYVAKLDGQKPEIKECHIDEVAFEAPPEVLSLRVTVPMHYIPGKMHSKLTKCPELCLQRAGVPAEDVLTSQWEVSKTSITGYMKLQKGKETSILAASGYQGVFIRRLARDQTTAKPWVTWSHVKTARTMSHIMAVS